MFLRIKVGVGGKPDGYDLADYVLGHFEKETEKKMQEAYDRAVQAVSGILTKGPDSAMNEFNLKV